MDTDEFIRKYRLYKSKTRIAISAKDGEVLVEYFIEENWTGDWYTVHTCKGKWDDGFQEAKEWVDRSTLDDTIKNYEQ